MTVQFGPGAAGPGRSSSAFVLEALRRVLGGDWSDLAEGMTLDAEVVRLEGSQAVFRLVDGRQLAARAEVPLTLHQTVRLLVRNVGPEQIRLQAVPVGGNAAGEPMLLRVNLPAPQGPGPATPAPRLVPGQTLRADVVASGPDGLTLQLQEAHAEVHLQARMETPLQVGQALRLPSGAEVDAEWPTPAHLSGPTILHVVRVEGETAWLQAAPLSGTDHPGAAQGRGSDGQVLVWYLPVAAEGAASWAELAVRREQDEEREAAEDGRGTGDVAGSEVYLSLGWEGGALGPVRADLVYQPGGRRLTLRLVMSQPAAQEALAAGLPALSERLAAQGFSLQGGTCVLSRPVLPAALHLGGAAGQAGAGAHLDMKR